MNLEAAEEVHPPHRRRHEAVKGLAFLLILAAAVVVSGQAALRPIEVEVDGDTTAATVLGAATVGEALQQAGVAVRPRDRVEPPLSASVPRDGRIRITRAFPVQIDDGGRSFEWLTTGGTVEQVLREAGLGLGEMDRVSMPLEAPVTGPLSVAVTRVVRETVVEQERVPFGTLRWAEPKWERGTTGLLREGRDGLLEHTYLLTYENGQLVSKKRVATRELQRKVDRIIGIGTRVVVRTVQTALGPLRYVEVKDMIATAYYPGPESTGPYADGFTATGLRAGHGVVAVDPRVIPLGTRVYIPGYGVAIAGDVGSAIRGNRIDLGFDTYREALHYGRKAVKVYILADG